MTIDRIYQICQREFGCELKDNRKKGKSPEGRSSFYFYCKRYYPKITHDQLGKYMAGRTHSTVTISLKKLDQTYISDPVFKKVHEHIGEILKKIADNEPVIKQEETPEQFELRLLRKQLKENEKEIEKLRKRTSIKFNNEIKKMLAQIPEHKLNDFKETRLRPYLKMNAI